jgi:hypothetical protein
VLLKCLSDTTADHLEARAVGRLGMGLGAILTATGSDAAGCRDRAMILREISTAAGDSLRIVTIHWHFVQRRRNFG